jgi:hypothetical protein
LIRELARTVDEDEAERVFDTAAETAPVEPRRGQSLDVYMMAREDDADPSEYASLETAVRMARFGDLDSCRLALHTAAFSKHMASTYRDADDEADDTYQQGLDEGRWQR